ncbi:iron-containing alcohol dehydrogenase [Paenibacillus sp. J5C_2022]|uniref:iron-containing alcohol dehydrogenase n=1 Tax=Paenibacillus sp. J5C2022 TaxID=2977129 RepID=UPI0021D23853|nr:iron-containing alcohol dehydrogenase [Paenibacillus sp. J5C2022]MCU6713123.1 iron-containing alcohol dehydrogenase [Paenibacillus sp. J5C2022]
MMDRRDLLQRSLEEWTASSLNCECGVHHRVELRKVVLEEGALGRVHDVLEELKLGGRLFLLSDQVTYEVAGRSVQEHLSDKGHEVASCILRGKPVYADELALGQALVELPLGTNCIVAAGSGTLNDIARYLSYKLDIPYIIVATAPSMDGFASGGSPLIIDGFKVTYHAVSPVAIVGDLTLLGQAPAPMIAAGVGDMLGKLTALADWQLASVVEEEHYCPLIADMMMQAVEACAEQAARLGSGAGLVSDMASGTEGGAGLASAAESGAGTASGVVSEAGLTSAAESGSDRGSEDVVESKVERELDVCAENRRVDATAIKRLMEGLILSGIAMGMLGNSRPASGSEHHLSHYWEMKHALRGLPPELHGLKVGVATLMILQMYDRLLELDARELAMAAKTPEELARWEKDIYEGYGPLAVDLVKANKVMFLPQEELDVRMKRLHERWDGLKRQLAACLEFVPYAQRILEQAGAALHPSDLNITKQDSAYALRYAKEVRSRYTILQLADQLGLLEQWSEEISERQWKHWEEREYVTRRADKVYWQAHRGGGAYEAPDNTMGANEYAWGLGGIPEADVRTTKDGVIVCLHDATLARTTTAPSEIANVPVSQLTFGEVSAWDAGVKFDAKFADERVPALEEVFQAMQGRPERLVYLDLKEVDLHQLGALIDRYKVNEQVIFTHYVQSNCAEMKAIADGVRCMLWIGGNAEQIKGTFQAARESGFEGLDQVQLHLNDGHGSDLWPYELEAEFLKEALEVTLAAGIDLEVLPFRFDQRSMSDLLDIGITWYATDEPARFVECVKTWAEAEERVGLVELSE